jgi:hypothetical protein
MTLFEVVLVTALLVVVGSLVVPVFTGSFSSVRLRRAGDQVLSQWAHARARAIETGETQQFRFTPATGGYVVEPWALIPLEESAGAPRRTREAKTQAEKDAAAAEVGLVTTGDGQPKKNGVLPSPITFHGGEIAASSSAERDERNTSLRSGDEGESAPILFFPDGSSSDASVTLVNDSQLYLRLTLRGLTGVGRASDVLSRDELDRASRTR